MTKKVIPVVFSTDDNYAPYVSACVESIKKNSSTEYSYDIRVFHVGLSGKTIELLNKSANGNVSVTCQNISENVASIKDKLYSHSYFSEEMYYRILIPEILSEYDKVIYLDCDMIVLGDLAELYCTDIGENAIAGCRNLMHEKMKVYVEESLNLPPEKYINSGMLVINCAEFIRQDIKNKIFSEISYHEILTYPDQDLINLVCQGSIHYLPINWNYLWHLERLNLCENDALKVTGNDLSEFIRASQDIKILHFTGDKKPWYCDAIPKAEIFWEYANASPFKSVIKAAFDKENADMEKIRLVFAQFRGKNLELVCSYNVMSHENNKTFLYSINGDIYKPAVFYKREISNNFVKQIQRLFTVRIPLKKIYDTKVIVHFSVNHYCVLFEYDKFFPLNGLQSSYFAHNGVLMYRENKALVLETCNFKKRRKHEMAYLKQLRKSDNPVHRKSALRRLMYFITKKFVPSNIWLISDRVDVGGDNGEALFKFLNQSKEYKKRVRSYFVIDPKSPDYKRLKKIGRVVKLSSFKHKILTLHADVQAVSQTNFPIYWVFERTEMKDLLFTGKKAFLQHGITKDDISNCYSRYFHDFDLFVTAAFPEYQSIIANRNYGCDDRITTLTGFPRHDLLENKAEKIIVFSPTWRKTLESVTVVDLVKFKDSDYYKAWHGIMASDEIKALAKEHGYKIQFATHNNIEPYIEAFSDLEHVEILCGNKNYADIFSRGALLISDYSSNTFEFSYLRKPVIYYQFDADIFFGSHTYKKGYFDYEKNGFGPVVKTQDELIDAIKSAVMANCQIEPEYEARINKFFKHSDNNNSKRVVDKLLGMRK